MLRSAGKEDQARGSYLGSYRKGRPEWRKKTTLQSQDSKENPIQE